MLTSGTISYLVIVGLILTVLLWVALLYPIWVKAIKRVQVNKDKLLPLYYPAAVTVMAVALVIFFFIPQGRSMVEENVDLHGAKEVREDFVESYEKDRADLQPSTKKELEEDREKRKVDTEALEKKKADERDGNAAESMGSFRKKMMNRNQEN